MTFFKRWVNSTGRMGNIQLKWLIKVQVRQTCHKHLDLSGDSIILQSKKETKKKQVKSQKSKREHGR